MPEPKLRGEKAKECSRDRSASSGLELERFSLKDLPEGNFEK